MLEFNQDHYFRVLEPPNLIDIVKCQLGHVQHHFSFSNCCTNKHTGLQPDNILYNITTSDPSWVRTHLNWQVMNGARAQQEEVLSAWWYYYMCSSNKWLCRALECRTTVSDVTAKTGPRYTACLDAIAVAQHNNQRINSDIWAILRACVSSESCKWILSILGALEQKETLSQKHVLLSWWPDKNICVLLQPVSCQFRWLAPSWRVLILWFVMPFSLGSIMKTFTTSY